MNAHVSTEISGTTKTIEGLVRQLKTLENVANYGSDAAMDAVTNAKWAIDDAIWATPCTSFTDVAAKLRLLTSMVENPDGIRIDGPELMSGLAAELRAVMAFVDPEIFDGTY